MKGFRPSCRPANNYVIRLNTERSIRNSGAQDETFDKPIVDRLNEFLQMFRDSKLHPFQWVSGLDLQDKLDLLAQLTAYQVSMTELRTDYPRKAARKEAAFVAEAAMHDIRNYWMPDADYYKGFGKPTLLDFIEQMGLDPEQYSAQKRGELAQTVAELGVENNFVPAALEYSLKEAGDEASDEDETPFEATEEDDNDQTVETFHDDEIDQAA